MAILQEQTSKFRNPFADQTKDDPAPAGTWVATIIDIRDEFGVMRPSFENPSVMETLDQTTFLFGYRDQAGQPHRIASKTMRISGNEKSNLMGFLKQALGMSPKYGWDYCAMKGQKVLITVAHEPRRSGQGTYPTIASLCPVPAGMGSSQTAGAVGSAQAGTPNAQAQTPAPAPAPVPSPVAVADDEELPF